MSTDIDVAYARASRVRLYTVIAVVCVPLTVWYLWQNVFLSPVFGVAGVITSLLIIRNGGPRAVGLLLFVLNGAPALFAGVVLISLVPNLPHLSFDGVSFVAD
jgi:hypothetical protein